MKTQSITDFGNVKFGQYATIEQNRYGASNEFYIYKVINTSRSNSWVDAPVVAVEKEVQHDSIEDVVWCICCGVMENTVHRFKFSEIKVYQSTDLKTEQDFIAHFKEQGFELYKTEDLKPKLDSLETLKKEKEELVEALESALFDVKNLRDYEAKEATNGLDHRQDHIDNAYVLTNKIQKIESILSTHKTQ
jgi:hypothetical protein